MIKQAPTTGRIVAMIAFTASCVGLLLFLWLSFGGTIPLKPQRYRVHVEFKQAANLADQADVRISGVPVGKVVAKKANPAKATTDVTLEIDSKYAPIPTDTAAVLRQKTLLGETYVELAPGNKSSGTIHDGGMIKTSNVAPTVQLDEIFRAFDEKTRTAFQQWMIDQGQVFFRHGQDLNDALGNLVPFADNTNTVLQILNDDKVDVRRLIRNTGSVFSALTERQGQLRGLISNSNRVFETTAARNVQLAETFHILPTFLTESRKTLLAVTKFSENTNPLVTQLRPAAQQLSPTLIELKTFAPELNALFTDLGPLEKASKAGLPATSEFLNQLEPLLAATDPFLRNLNPIIAWLGMYQHEITAFFANDVASTQAASLGADQKAQLHYLRTTNPLNPENLATYPTRISSNRSNPYVGPLQYSHLPIKVFGTYACTNNPIPPMAPDTNQVLPQELVDLINRFAYNNGNVTSPPCAPQPPLGNLVGQNGVYPHINEQSP